MKSFSKIIALISVLLAVLLVGFAAISFLRANGNNGAGGALGGPPGAGMAVPVRTVVVESVDFENRQAFNGSVRPREQVEITSEVSGRVASLYFEDGDTVEKGALLVRIDDKEQLAQARAVSEELNMASINAERLQTLWQSEGIPQRDLDEALSRRNVLAAQLENLQARIEKYQVTAPFSGKLGFREISVGALAQPGMRITTLQSIDPSLIDFPVAERYRNLFTTGLPISARVSGSDTVFGGEVFRIDPRIDPSTRTVTVRGIFPNPDGVLQSGGFARVRVNMVTPDSIVVPATAVVRGLLDVAVFVVVDGRAERRVVELGERTEDAVEILQGVLPGDELIVDGTQRVRPGVTVTVLNTGSAIPAVEAE